MLFSNPILMKELRCALRRGRPFVLMGAYVAALGIVIALAFPDQIRFDPRSNPTYGREIFYTFSLWQALLILAFTPAIAASALTLERERQTLETLLVSGMSAWTIVWGKFLYSLFHLTLLLLASLPLTATCFMFGGVSPWELAAVYLALLLGAAVLAAASIQCSAHFHKSYLATAAAYLVVPLLAAVLWCFVWIGWIVAAPIAILGMGKAVMWTHERTRQRRLGLLAPVFVGGAVLALPVGMAALAAQGYLDWQYAVAALAAVPGPVLLCWLCLSTAATVIVRLPDPRVPARRRWESFVASLQTSPNPDYAQVVRIAGDAPPPQGAGTEAPPLQTTRHSPLTAPHAGSTRRGDLQPTYGVRPFIAENANPVLAKELRASLFGRKDLLIRALYISTIATELLLLFLCLVPEFVMSGEAVFRGWAMLDLVAIMAGGAVFAALSVGVEKEQRTLPLLFASPLSARAVVEGKFLAICFYTSYIVLASLPVTGFCMALQIIPASEGAVFLASQLVYGLAAVALGLTCSVVCAQARQAVGWALGVVFASITGTLLLHALMPAAWDDCLYDSAYAVASAPLGVLLAHTLLPLNTTGDVLWAASAPARQGASGFYFLWFASLVLYLALALALLHAAVWWFEREVRRGE